MFDPTYFGYGGFRFSWGDHICAIFDHPSQQMEIMTGFIAHGLRAGQQCVWVAPEVSARQFREALVSIGCDMQTLEASGQLTVISEVEFYLQQNLFEPERTMSLLLSLIAEGRRSGYELMRFATDTSWLRGYRVDPDLWERYEARLTDDLVGLPAAMVCQYDRRQVSGSVVIAAFRTHPVVILGEEIHQNPFYTPSLAGPAASEIV